MKGKQKSFEKRKELYDAALKEFGDKGYEKASLNNILKVTGISKGTFYYHFKNKEDIYIYLMKNLIQEKKNYFASNIKEDIFSKDLFDILQDLIHLGIEFAKKNPSINKFSEQFLKEKNNQVIQKIFKKLNVEVEGSNFLDVYIETAYQKHEIREDIPKDFIKNLINYLFIHVTDFSDVAHIEDTKLIAKYLIKFIKSGIKK